MICPSLQVCQTINMICLSLQVCQTLNMILSLCNFLWAVVEKPTPRHHLIPIFNPSPFHIPYLHMVTFPPIRIQCSLDRETPVSQSPHISEANIYEQNYVKNASPTKCCAVKISPVKYDKTSFEDNPPSPTIPYLAPRTTCPKQPAHHLNSDIQTNHPTHLAHHTPNANTPKDQTSPEAQSFIIIPFPKHYFAQSPYTTSPIIPTLDPAQCLQAKCSPPNCSP